MARDLLSTYPTGTGVMCPVCNSDKDEITILVPIYESHSEYIPVHAECILNNVEYSEKLNLMGLETKEGVTEASII